MSERCPYTGLPIAAPGAGLTEKQLADRVGRLTGSKIAQALGYSDYAAPSQLWRIDMGLDVQEINEAMWVGTEIEDFIARFAQKRLMDAFPDEGYDLMFKPDTIYHATQRQWFLTHPDRIYPRAHTGLQIKNHDPSMAAKMYPHMPLDEGRDNAIVPMMHRMQVLWEWESVRSWLIDAHLWQHWWLAVYFGGTRLRLYRLTRESKLLDSMISAGWRWWLDHLWSGGPQTEPSDDLWHARMQKRAAKEAAEIAVRPQWTAEEKTEAKRGVQSLEELFTGAA